MISLNKKMLNQFFHLYKTISELCKKLSYLTRNLFFIPLPTQVKFFKNLRSLLKKLFLKIPTSFLFRERRFLRNVNLDGAILLSIYCSSIYLLHLYLFLDLYLSFHCCEQTYLISIHVQLLNAI